MHIQIYALCDPNTGEIRYIGKANDSRKRLISHIRDCPRRNTPLYCWMRSMEACPTSVVLAHAIGDWKQLEIDVIKQHRENGARLLNIALGGDEPFCPKEIRADNGRKNAAAIHSDPNKKRIWKLKLMIGQSVRNGYTKLT